MIEPYPRAALHTDTHSVLLFGASDIEILNRDDRRMNRPLRHNKLPGRARHDEI